MDRELNPESPKIDLTILYIIILEKGNEMQ